MKTFIFVNILIIALACSAFGASSEDVVIKNAGFARTLSVSAGLLKTTKIEANGAQVLDQPSIEFMIEIENKGELVTLIPGDFEIKELHKETTDRQDSIMAALSCNRDGYPINIVINYTAEIKSEYQQKSIIIEPCKKLKNATLRRISIDDCRFKAEYLPVVPVNAVELLDAKADAAKTSSAFSYDSRSDFGAFDPKTNRGLYFFTGAAKPICYFTTGHNLSICEEMNVPMDKGYETSKAMIGAISGSPDMLLARYRLLTLSSQFAALGRAKQFASFKKSFGPYFSVCKYLNKDDSSKNISQEAHIINGAGFLVITNSSNDPQKIVLPLDALGLSDINQLRLTDWSALDSPAGMGMVIASDKVELELPPNVPRIIGINLPSPK